MTNCVTVKENGRGSIKNSFRIKATSYTLTSYNSAKWVQHYFIYEIHRATT